MNKTTSGFIVKRVRLWRVSLYVALSLILMTTLKPLYKPAAPSQFVIYKFQFANKS